MRISLEHLSNEALVANLLRHVRDGYRNTALVLAHLAEMDERKLYLELGYSSMCSYCIDELHFSEDAAKKRLQAARAARRVPAILAAVADGRLHLSAVAMLAPHLDRENAAELLAAATHKTKREVEELVAEWCPRLDEPSLLTPVAEPAVDQGAPGHLDSRLSDGVPPTPNRDNHEHVSSQRAPGHPRPPSQRPSLKPLGQRRFVLRATIGESTQDKLRYLCEFARGGVATAANIRLRCRAHNQYEAERVFGVAFMQHKREEARRAADHRLNTAADDAAARNDVDLIPCLRQLGFRVDEAAPRHTAKRSRAARSRRGCGPRCPFSRPGATFGTSGLRVHEELARTRYRAGSGAHPRPPVRA